MQKVSILMSVYNCEEYLSEAIESILAQTYREFEFIIINDGSTDNSLDIIKKYKDERIKLIENKTNMGLIYSLNKGIFLSKSEYIIRMDSDDISKIDRIEKQLRYMDKNKNIDILGAKSTIFGKNIKSYESRCVFGKDNIMATLLFNNCITHPSVIMRRKSLEKYKLKYREEFIGCEDYDLWNQNINLNIENMDENVISYRIVENGVTQSLNKKREKKYKIISKLHKRLISRFWKDVSEKDLTLHFNIGENNYENVMAKDIEIYFDKLLRNNKIYDLKSLKSIMGKKWIKLCIYKKRIYINRYFYYGLLQGGKEVCHYLKRKYY